MSAHPSLVGPIMSFAEGPTGCVRVVTRPISAHTSHVSWPHRELRRRPQWLRPHGDSLHFDAPLNRS
eukprot:2147020-Pyramimonas_sp.AAC.1